MGAGLSLCGLFEFAADIWKSTCARRSATPGAENSTAGKATFADYSVLLAPEAFCVVIWGEGTWVTAADPFNYQKIPCEPIEQVFAIPGKPIIVFASSTKMVAYGEEGLLWSTPLFSNEQWEILKVTADSIFGRAWDAEIKKQVEFVVRVDSGDCQMSKNADR